jgi:hypothetical protein
MLPVDILIHTYESNLLLLHPNKYKALGPVTVLSFPSMSSFNALLIFSPCVDILKLLSGIFQHSFYSHNGSDLDLEY